MAVLLTFTYRSSDFADIPIVFHTEIPGNDLSATNMHWRYARAHTQHTD